MIACCCNANVAVGFDLVVRSGSCLACQCQCAIEKNMEDMTTCPWASECSFLNSFCALFARVLFQCSVPHYINVDVTLSEHILDTTMMTKWFYSTRLETRIKESNSCASLWAATPACAMKVTAGMIAPATDLSIERGLSMSMSVRTRKMVNYA